jgi:hypothetical protein
MATSVLVWCWVAIAGFGACCAAITANQSAKRRLWGWMTVSILACAFLLVMSGFLAVLAADAVREGGE